MYITILINFLSNDCINKKYMHNFLLYFIIFCVYNMEGFYAKKDFSKR